MNETTILLAPAPKAKGDFLATVEPLAPPTGSGGGGWTSGGDELPFEITLDNYTRDGWAARPPNGDPANWRTVWLKSVDGRRKLPGFLKYLNERKKSAFGKFESTTEDGSSVTKAVMVVPFEQPPPPSDVLAGGESPSADDVVCCRYALDEKKVKGLYLPPPAKQPQQQRHPHQGQGRLGQPPGRAHQMPPQQKKPAPAPGPSKVRVGGKSGLLGNLLGASRRTNEHLNVVPAQKKKDGADGGGEGGGDGGEGGEFALAAGTSGAAIAKFRTRIEQQLLDFQRSAAEVSVKIKVNLGDITRGLSQDQKANVTMDVLKFVLYEQADEIGEEQWIAHREPSEFLDEMVVAVYKEGHAPEEVLEEMNKGEMPDEIRQQQRAMAEARSKEMARKEAKHDAMLHQKMVGGAGGEDSSFTRLNTEKRDRRTIEEIQKDMGHDVKRSRTE